MTNAVHGQTAALIARIAQNLPPMSADVMQGWIDNPKGLKKFLSGMMPPGEDVVRKHIIDCDAEPYCPGGCEVMEHRKGGQLDWDHAKVGLYLCDQQKTGSIKGNKLRKTLANKPVLNDCVLDYLLANPYLIPEEWKGKAIFFWGTIYRYSDGHLCVRYLYWHGSGWGWNYDWLSIDWGGNDPAAVSLSAS